MITSIMVTESDSQQTQEPHTQHQTDGNASFLRAARAGNLDKVLEYLKGSIDINTSNANGLNALHLASKEGHVAVVTELLKRGANVNAATKKGNTALHIASLAGQDDVVKVLIQNGANVNVQSLNGFSPLYMAAQENHDSVVRYLLSNGANQSLATEDGFTPLAVALQQGHDKVVAVLLENDTKGKVRLPALHVAAKKDDCKAAALLLQNDHNPDVTSKSGFTPLHIASHYGNENIAAVLLDKNADVNFVAKHQITPLHVAAKWGKVNMVSLLLDRKAKIDAATRDGLTPLHCAARSGHESVVDLLLERGAPISAKTKNGLAPLHMSAQGDHVESARILLFHKAPVDDITVDYLTALHVAAHCGHVRVAKLLLDRKADPNSRALNGFTPLHIACKKNRIKVVELLLKHGASIEATTESGLTPLHVAAFMGCMNIVIYLIQHLASPDVPTVRGETPLHLAARANQTDIIRILLRNGAQVDAKAREHQTPLHIASRLGNVDIVGLLLQHGAAVDAVTKDMYTSLHIAAKEGQEEVASVLLDNGASLTSTTKKGFTPLHLAAKYGNIKVARLLISKDAPVDAQGKNNVTPLHCAAHYDHVNVALLLLEKGASPHATAKNGYCPLHIAARKNQMDIATTLLEYGAKANAESKAGFTPLHLAAQEGHTDMTTLLIGHKASVNMKAKNSLTPLHLCAQEDRVNAAAILVKNGADISPQTKAGYTPLHVASHFGQINMIRFLLQNGADVNATNAHGYTPLHQAAQQGHTSIVNLLLEHKASPNATTNQGQTALSIAQRLGYISVVETLKVVTETVVTTTTTTITEEKYKVIAPETMQETFMSDSEDEGADDNMLGDQSYRYLTADEMKSLGDDSLPFDVTKDERVSDSMLNRDTLAPITVEEELFSPHHMAMTESYVNALAPDNIDISRAPITAGRLKWKTFLVSFMVDARGGAMRGCRHSGVRVIIPPRKAPMPMRITCRYLRKEKLIHPPPLMEGEACASRLLEVGPAGAKFLGPVIIEVPHFASLRGKEREIIILRSDNGETWREHTLEASEEAVQEVLNESFDGENDVNTLDDFSSNRITRILTTDFPQYFAVITRIRQEVHAIGPEGGMVSSTVVPQVQAIFPEGALTKKIKVGLQAQPIPSELVTKMLGNRVAVSPICTIEPRRRKFHKPITLTIPVPQAATRGMINQYTGDAPTLRLLCSITGGTSKAQWEDVTGSTPLTFVNDCVSFTTTVSARFWLIDCRQVNEATKFATELYQEAIHVPFMSKFVVFAKRSEPLEAQLRVFCMTDDKEEKTLENQEHFNEVAKSRDVEVLESKPQYLEFAGNLVPVTKSGEQLSLTFQAFRENRLPFIMRVKDSNHEPLGRIAFMRENRKMRTEQPQIPICNLNIELPDICKEDLSPNDFVTLEKQYDFIKETKLSTPEMISRADIYFVDVSKALGPDWVTLANQFDIPKNEIQKIQNNNPDSNKKQAHEMLRYWSKKVGPQRANGNALERGLRAIQREDIIISCTSNVQNATDSLENAIHKIGSDQNEFNSFKEELGPSRNTSRGTSLGREVSLDVSYDEQDIMKEAESAEESGSEAGVSSLKDHLILAEKERSRPTSETDDENERKRLDDNSERALAAQKFLEFLEEEDKEESEERAKYRGEEFEIQPELFVVTEEMVIPSEVQNNLKDDFTEIKTTETTSVLEDGTIKHTITAVTKSTVVQDPEEQARLLLETETWHSGEQDTSQVSVSSLPEDEKSEPSTATVSSTTTTNTGDNIASALVTTSIEDDPHFDLIVEQKEWTEEDDSGSVQHIIEQTSSLTTDESDPKSKSTKKDTASIATTNACTLERQYIKQSFLPSNIGLKDHDNDDSDRDRSLLPKPSPPEAVADVIDEQLSPVCDYSNYISPELQVKVGISPTDELLANTRAYETQISSEELLTNKKSVLIEENVEKLIFETKSDICDDINTEKLAQTESAYENTAFAGTENIDSNVSEDSGERSPYEVVRDDIFQTDKSFDIKPDSMPKFSDRDSKKDDKRSEMVDNKLEGKVMKQIVSEIFAKELEEEIMNGSPERKIIHNVAKTDRKVFDWETEIRNEGMFGHKSYERQQITDLDDENYEEIRREASLIAQTIVGKAKEEMAKMPHKNNISSDISDEDLVEQGSDENEDEVKNFNEVISSHSNESEEIDSQNPALIKAQKRISFTESDTLFTKEESFEDKGSVVLEKSLSPEELKHTLSDPRKSSDSGSRSGSQKGKESGSSSESHYHSFDVSDSSKTPATSRPTSSEFDLTIIPEQQCLSVRSGSGSGGGIGFSGSEYETCATSQEGSYTTAATSQETTYCTAQTSLCSPGSRESTISLESESSGHLGEVSSEASETIIPGDDKERHASLSDDDYDQNGSVTPVNDEIQEPFDSEIPESVIRSGIEMPFMSGSNWEVIEQRDNEGMHSSSTFEIISCEEIEDIPLESNLNLNITPLLQSNNSIDEQSLSENSNTWHSSSVGTAIHITGQPNSGNGSVSSLGQISGCVDSTQSVFRSFSDSISSLENLNSIETQQQTIQISESINYSNGPVEVDYNPEYDVSDYERGSTQSQSNTIVSQQYASQEERTSSSDMTSDTQVSDTPLVSQSSFCSSVLSEQTRHQLSYDLSPEVHSGIADSLTLGSDDVQRPESPVPPEVEDFVYLESSKESNDEFLQKKSAPNDTSNSAFDKNLMSDPSLCCEHSDLYTHQEVDEDIDESQSQLGNQLSHSKPIPFPSSRSGESSAASSLKEFERLEAEMKGKSSLHGSSDSIGSSYGSGKLLHGRGSDRDEHSVSSSIVEFEKLEKDLSDAERLEKAAQEEAARLSEIEEGHESQASDASQETLSEGNNDEDDDTDSDYEKKMSEIDDMMKYTQNNVEKMREISRGVDNSMTSDTQSNDLSLSDSIRDNKGKLQSQGSSASVAQILLTRKIVSTESMDSHPRSSICSTTNTESLNERIEDLDEIKSEFKDENKSMSSDSMQDDDKLDKDFNQEMEYQTETTSANASSKSSYSESYSPLGHESTHVLSSDFGPALATLREENDFDEDSLKESFHGILKGGDCMLSSTDSLEITSSAGTHATYHLEGGSAMSSSVNSYLTSGDESTMVSSRETPDLLDFVDQRHQMSDYQNDQLKRLFENELKLLDESENIGEEPIAYKTDDKSHNKIEDEFEEIQSYDERGNLKVFRRVKRSVPNQQTFTPSFSENEEKFLEILKKSAKPGTEVIEEEKSFGESGSVIMKRTVKTIAVQGPDLRTKSVTGESADKETEEFLEPFTKLEPYTNVDEYEGIDESGNPFKVYKEVTITPEVRAVTFTGPDAQQKFDQFMNKWSGDKSELIEINTPVTNTNSSHTSHTSQTTDSVEPHDTQSDFGKYNGKKSRNNESSGFSGSTRIVTETVSEKDGHKTLMETTIHHSQESDPLRESMQQILDQFMSDKNTKLNTS